MSKVLLISGASGFVGINLRRRFKKSWEILLLGRSEVDNDYTWETLESAKIRDIDCYIHLAAKAHDIKDVNQPREYFDVNVGLTKKMFDLFLASNARTFIYFSSVKAVAHFVEGRLTENESPTPKTPYGKSKLEAEKYLNHPKHKKELKNKRVIIVRPCMIHGPGNKGNLNLLYKKIKNRVPYPFGCFSNKRSFLSIDNLSFAINAIIENAQFPQGIYNIADDKPLSSNEVVNIINKRLNKKSNIWNIPPFLVEGLAKIGDYTPLPISSESVTKLTQNYIVSNKKIKDALGIKEFPVSSKEGLMITIDSFNQ